MAVGRRLGLAGFAQVVVAGGMLLGVSTAVAAPDPQTPGASVMVSPAQAGAGEAVRVSVTGVAGLPPTGTNLCIGFLGPGNNLELGLSPRFQSRIGTVAISASGSGAADVRVPVQAVAGVYRIRVGGCPPQPDLAPLAAIAETQLTVTRGGPSGLPATGGAPAALGAGAALGALMALGGATLRLITRSRGGASQTRVAGRSTRSASRT